MKIHTTTAQRTYQQLGHVVFIPVTNVAADIRSTVVMPISFLVQSNIGKVSSVRTAAATDLSILFPFSDL